MGNQIDKRAQFEGGYLYVKTDKPFYLPGENVLGKIYLRTEVPIDATDIQIHVKGKEKLNFETGEGKSKAYHSHKKLLFEFKNEVWKFEGTLQPGDYTLPFEFMLPASLPASCVFSKSNDFNRPRIKVKYAIKSTISTPDNKAITYKQWLIIHESPVAF